MSSANLDSADLTGLDLNGMIREDVMDQIFDISKIPLPFTDRIGRGSHSNAYFEWPVDRLAAPDTTNAVIDGSESRTDGSSNPTYARVGNHSQISVKDVFVSHRAQAVNTVGFRNALAYQLMMRGNELRRDVEAIALSNQASFADTGAAAGTTAGLEAWIGDEDELGTVVYDATAGNASQYRDLSTGGITSIGGWPNHTAGVIPAVDYTAVTAVNALTETAIKDVVEQLYTNGSNPTVLMSRPAVIRRLSEYMFTSSARIATLTNQSSDAVKARVAQGAVNVWLTDFGVSMEFVPNRLQQLSGDGSPDSSTVYIFDPSYISLSYLEGYRTYPLAKIGLADKREMAVDWGLRVNNWTALGGILGIDETAAVTAS